MKVFKYITSITIGTLILGMTMSTVLTSCKQDGDGMFLESPDGPPVIEYIRLADPNTADSLIVSAELGAGIVIVGSNLGGTREIFFNDKQAPLLPNWVSNTYVFADVPRLAPDVITNTLYLVDANGDTLKHDFVVAIPPPLPLSAKNEWPQAEEDLVINGDYFFAPVTVTFTGTGDEADLIGEIKSISQTQVVVSVPENATEGPVTVKTNFGEVVSPFHVWDKRNVILNFDDKVANGWRTGHFETGDGELEGNYNVFRWELGPNERNEGSDQPNASVLAFEYWGGRDGRTENFYPYYPGSYKEYVLKFEAKVTRWNRGYLNICFATPTHDNSNQEYWSNNINARAIWGPWAAAGEEFTTDGQWITVSVPLTEFQYYMSAPADVEYEGGQKFVEDAAGSLSMWLLGSPAVEGVEENEVEFYVDNIRIVPIAAVEE